jgi:hypothetical protein
MNCKRVRRRLTMEGEDASDLSGHLYVCGECREEAERLTAEHELIREAFDALSVRPDFTSGVLARIRRLRA